MRYNIGDKVKLFLDEDENMGRGVIAAHKNLTNGTATIDGFTGAHVFRKGYYMKEIKWVWYDEEIELITPEHEHINTRFEILDL